MISKPIIRLSAGLRERLTLNLPFRIPRWVPVRPLMSFIAGVFACVVRLAVPLIVLLFWDIAAQQHWVSDQYLPAPALVWQCFLRMIETGELWFHVDTSLTRLIGGLLIGITLGVGFALSLFYSRMVAQFFYSSAKVLRQIPLLAFIPLLALWLANDNYIELLLVSLAVFYPMAIKTYEELQHANKGYLELAQLYGFSRWLQFRKILFPASLPGVVSGLVTAVPLAWLICIGSELLLDAGAGIGGLMRAAQSGAEVDVIIVCIFVLTVLSVLMNFLIARLSRYLLRLNGSPS